MSLRDIGRIIAKETGDQELVEREKKRQEAETVRQNRKSMSPYARAFQMFKDKRTLADVAIELDLKSSAVLNFYNDYLDLIKMSWIVHIYNDPKWNFNLFLHLYKRIEREGLNKQDVTHLIKNQQKLKDLDDGVQQYCKFIQEQQLQKQQLEKEIENLRTI